MNNKNIIDNFFNYIFDFDHTELSDLFINIQIENNENNINEINKLKERRPLKEKILNQIDFILGEGTKIIYE